MSGVLYRQNKYEEIISYIKNELMKIKWFPLKENKIIKVNVLYSMKNPWINNNGKCFILMRVYDKININMTTNKEFEFFRNQFAIFKNGDIFYENKNTKLNIFNLEDTDKIMTFLRDKIIFNINSKVHNTYFVGHIPH